MKRSRHVAMVILALTAAIFARPSVALEVGQMAPDFELPATTGGTVRLSDFRGQKMVLLEFYHSDWGPTCTANISQRRDDFDLFAELGVQVIGISMSHTYSQAAFAQSLDLNFPLLSDFPHGRTILSYEVGFEEGEAARLSARPSFFLVDKDGIIRGYWGERPKNPDEVLPPDPLVSSQPMLEAARAIVP